LTSLTPRLGVNIIRIRPETRAPGLDDDRARFAPPGRIVTLAELTPVSEAAVLQDDLRRAGIEPFGWVINASLTASGTHDPVLLARATLEGPHLNRVRDQLAARARIVPWQVESLIGEERLAALSNGLRQQCTPFGHTLPSPDQPSVLPLARALAESWEISGRVAEDPSPPE